MAELYIYNIILFFRIELADQLDLDVRQVEAGDGPAGDVFPDEGFEGRVVEIGDAEVFPVVQVRVGVGVHIVIPFVVARVELGDQPMPEQRIERVVDRRHTDRGGGLVHLRHHLLRADVPEGHQRLVDDDPLRSHLKPVGG